MAERGISNQAKTLLSELGVADSAYAAGALESRSPIDGQRIGAVAETKPAAVGAAIEAAHAAFLGWRNVPAPKRGDSCAYSAKNCARKRARLGGWCRSKRGKSRPKVWAKCRR